VEGAGTDNTGRYICIGSGFVHGIAADELTDAENDDEWD
jgi:hypothetical protein